MDFHELILLVAPGLEEKITKVRAQLKAQPMSPENVEGEEGEGEDESDEEEEDEEDYIVWNWKNGSITSYIF